MSGRGEAARPVRARSFAGDARASGAAPPPSAGEAGVAGLSGALLVGEAEEQEPLRVLGFAATRRSELSDVRRGVARRAKPLDEPAAAAADRNGRPCPRRGFRRARRRRARRRPRRRPPRDHNEAFFLIASSPSEEGPAAARAGPLPLVVLRTAHGGRGNRLVAGERRGDIGKSRNMRSFASTPSPRRLFGSGSAARATHSGRRRSPPRRRRSMSTMSSSSLRPFGKPARSPFRTPSRSPSPTPAVGAMPVFRRRRSAFVGPVKLSPGTPVRRMATRSSRSVSLALSRAS